MGNRWIDLDFAWTELKRKRYNLDNNMCYDKDKVQADCEKKSAMMENVGKDDTIGAVNGLEYILHVLNQGNVDAAESMARKLLYDAKQAQARTVALMGPSLTTATPTTAVVPAVFIGKRPREDEQTYYPRQRGAPKKNCAWCTSTGKWIPITAENTFPLASVVEPVD